MCFVVCQSCRIHVDYMKGSNYYGFRKRLKTPYNEYLHRLHIWPYYSVQTSCYLEELNFLGGGWHLINIALKA
jgi:hypothetical protein